MHITFISILREEKHVKIPGYSSSVIIECVFKLTCSSGKSEFSNFKIGCLSHFSGTSHNHLGPFHHSSWLTTSVAEISRDAQSAGLSHVGMRPH